MNDLDDVVVLSAVRTAIGRYGGGLASVPPCDLAATVVREAVSRAGVEPADVGHAVFGNVIHTETRDMYLGRVAAINGGLPVTTPAFTVNRLCGSGLQAIVSAAQAIWLGDADAAVAGGAESMSRAPYWLPGMRWGQRMNDGVAVDAMTGALSDPWDGCHMGVTAENVATDFGVSRADQDALAAESHRRAAAAQAAGYFSEQILPVEIAGKRGKTTIVDTDEHVRPEVSLADMAKLRPAFTSNTSISSTFRPVRSSSRRTAGTGPMPMIRGSTPACAYPISLSTGVRPLLLTNDSDASTTAAAASLTPEALPAVTVPSLANAGRSLAMSSSLTSARTCSSVSTTVTLPLLPGISTGRICSLK